MKIWQGIVGAMVILGTVTAVLGQSTGPGPLHQATSTHSDFALFTTEKTGGVFDDFVTCTATREAELHLTATNFDPDEVRINIVFQDLDLVTVKVPTGQSFSLTHVIGTVRNIDNVIKIDPQDQDGDVNPMVGWISITRAWPEGGARVGCSVTTSP